MDRSFFRFVTMHACDRRTDRRTEFSSLDRVCIACSVVKIRDVAITSLLYPHRISLSDLSQFWHLSSCAGRNQSCQKVNSIGSGVLEPQIRRVNRYLPLTGGIALTTVYALTCYTVIHCSQN